MSSMSKNAHTSSPRALLWLRRDLRLHDNEALHEALTWFSAQEGARAQRGELLCVWCWTSADEARSGERKAWFWRESALKLQAEVRALGGELLCVRAEPAQLLPKLVDELTIERVFAQRLSAYDEVREEERLSATLAQRKVSLSLASSYTLFERAELPFALRELPDVFTSFRKAVERSGEPQHPRPAPSKLPPAPALPSELQGELEPLAPLSAPEVDERAPLAFVPGERAALERLKAYLWENRHVERYHETRNELIGEAFSTKLSPWLATGALSPRQVWREVRRYERERVENKSTYWVLFELLWREYFQWVALKWGPHLFQREGLRGAQRGLSPQRAPLTLSRAEDQRLLRWVEGRTGQPFVDANMRELAATGWMSNRGRQNVASYLVHDLKVDWRAGAAYFERALIDEDPASNWGNWAYVSGVGNDPRPQRRFNVRSQAERYDPKGRYQALWAQP